MAVFSVMPEQEARDFTVGGVLNRTVDSVTLAICYPGLFTGWGIGRRIVEPIIDASICITGAVKNLQQHELMLDTNLSVEGREAYGTLDYLIKCNQGSIVVKLAETEEPLNSPSQEHQVGQILIQMATVRDIDQDPSTASEDYTKDLFGVLTSGQEWVFYKYAPGNSNVDCQRIKLRETEGEGRDAIAPRVKQLVEAMVGVLVHQSGAR